ncbi:hypothetical protein VMT65_12195 [Nocardia sp. CDC153]|uniref:hypothetical protein n=1 Tax=Nocardia sp. CDC153 TaxID=3112167 RepID=UPI002DBC3521|nr:hypothetical protein [Nocardia sp. CDC153]MEC3953791.1 hypothetical protein [Nocardia sp. CDC153]
MAYLSTRAAAASNGEYGRGGSGEIYTHWHNMPDATVESLPVGDSRGKIEIRWSVDSYDRVLACLTMAEAHVLRDRLTAIITEVEGPEPSVTDNEVDNTVIVNADGTVRALDDEPVFCRDCGGRISLLSNGTDFWWTHEPHSINDHEPLQFGPVYCRVCGGRISLVTTENDRWWVHYFDPWDEHDALPGHVTVPRTSGEAA